MGNGNDNHQSIHDQRSIFLPMFCRLSIKDVKLNNHCTVPISAVEPSSPKVSCVGQVKRNNRVIGFPTTATISSITATANHHKHTKPKKLLFSTKTLLPNPATMNVTATAKAAGGGGRRSGSCRTNREMCVNNLRRSRVKNNCDQNGDQDCVKEVVDIREMDPPLPVVKRVAPPGGGRDEVNLWKRRLNGVKSLQIEPIHLPNNKFQLPPTTL